jgi:hypothetical protein
VTRLQAIVPDQQPEESTILDLEAHALSMVETPTTDFLTPFIVPIQFYEHHTVLHTAMETNVVTPSRNSSIPTTVVPTGEFSPPNPSSSVRATMVSTASTSLSGLIPSLVAATTPFTPSAIGPPFSNGMPSSGTSPVLSYSSLQNLGLGVGSSSAPLQGHIRGTPTPFNLSLMEEVISLLRPLHSVAHISSLSGNLYTIVYLEQGVKDHFRIVCR